MISLIAVLLKKLNSNKPGKLSGKQRNGNIRLQFFSDRLSGRGLKISGLSATVIFIR